MMMRHERLGPGFGKVRAGNLRLACRLKVGPMHAGALTAVRAVKENERAHPHDKPLGSTLEHEGTAWYWR
jgi:hypothetical protein